MRRAASTDVCRAVESWNVPLLVIRKEHTNLIYNDSFANPMDSTYKSYVRDYERGIGGCYPHTTLRNAFVAADVNEIVNPRMMNASWESGLLFNTTVHFRKGAVRIPSDVYYELVRYIIERNGYEVGDSGLYLNEYQPNPYKPCFKVGLLTHFDFYLFNSDISRMTAIQRESAMTSTIGLIDASVVPDSENSILRILGRNASLSTDSTNAKKKEDNECSENARCIDLTSLQMRMPTVVFGRCSSRSRSRSVCVLDYCSDVNFCPTNTTCKNMEQQAECRCDPGFTDIRKSEHRNAIGLGDDTLCMHVRDVNECALGLTNCSGVAECIDRPIGYTCRCPEGYIDGSPDEPGRVCGALLCDLCNSHGDCVHNAQTNNITCVCSCPIKCVACVADPACLTLPPAHPLACLLYFCTKCHCFKARGIAGGAPFVYRRGGAWPWSTLEGSSSSESGAEFSALSAAGHDYYPDIGIPRAKLKAGAVVTDAGAKSMDVARLEQYLSDGAVRIPRAHLVGSSGRLNETCDSMSDASSEYTIKEEIERSDGKGNTTKEIKTTTTTDAAGNIVTTTAETYAYPQHTVSHGENAAEASRTSVLVGDSSSYAARNAEYSNAAAFSDRQYRHSGAEERERGESVAEFSIGRAKSKDYLTRERDVVEYSSEQDMSQSEEHEVGDVHTRVSHSHHYEPIRNGESERFRSEMVTSQKSTSVTKH
ncbi:EGF-like domain protein [Ostertagia ostertagi]